MSNYNANKHMEFNTFIRFVYMWYIKPSAKILTRLFMILLTQARKIKSQDFKMIEDVKNKTNFQIASASNEIMTQQIGI